MPLGGDASSDGPGRVSHALPSQARNENLSNTLVELSAQVGQLQAREQSLTTMIKLKVSRPGGRARGCPPAGRTQGLLVLGSKRAQPGTRASRFPPKNPEEATQVPGSLAGTTSVQATAVARGEWTALYPASVGMVMGSSCEPRAAWGLTAPSAGHTELCASPTCIALAGPKEMTFRALGRPLQWEPSAYVTPHGTSVA